MADLLNFGGFIKKTLQRREAEAEKPAEPKQESTESQPTMSQGDFSYGPEGMRKKKPTK